jgi:tetratricopeptide (TPR) repeat protein
MGKKLDANYYCEQGFKEFEAENLKKAIAHYAKAIKLDPKNVDAHFGRGSCICLTDKPDYKIAIKDFLKVLKLKSNWLTYPCYSNLACVENRIGNYEKALEFSIKAIRLNHKEPINYFDRAEARFLLNCLEAIKDLTKAIKLNPQWGDAYFRRYICKRGMFLHTDESTWKSEAEKDLRKALKLGSQLAQDFEDKKASKQDKKK